MTITYYETALELPCFLREHPFDDRYYRLLEATQPEYPLRYLLLKEEGRNGVVQPFFVVRQDLFEGLPEWGKRGVALLRRLWPRFGFTQLLMVGCPVGEGALESDQEAEIVAILQALESRAAGEGISLIVLKEMPERYRPLLRVATESLGYERIPSMPSATLKLDFKSFEDYLTQRLSRSMRKNLRRKFRVAESAGHWEMRVVNRIDPWVEEIHALYTQTRARSPYRFEHLSKAYFQALGATMGDRARFFLWHLEGRLVAFALCWEHEGTLYDLNLGLDYEVALRYHLYFYTWRDLISWALSHGLHTYHTGSLNYEPKLHLKLQLEPVDLYVKHRSRWIAPLLQKALVWLTPVRYDPVLSRFPHAEALFHDRKRPEEPPVLPPPSPSKLRGGSCLHPSSGRGSASGNGVDSLYPAETCRSGAKAGGSDSKL